MALSDEIKKGYRTLQETEQLGPSLYGAATKNNPDKQAEIIRLAESQKLPIDTVERNMDEVRRQEQLSKFNHDELREKNPGLAKFLSDDKNAAVSIDDFDNLKAIEDAYAQESKPWYQADVGKVLKNWGPLAAESMKQATDSALLSIMEFSNPNQGDVRFNEMKGSIMEGQAPSIQDVLSRDLLKDITDSNKRISELTPEDMTVLEQALHSTVQSLTLQLPLMAVAIATRNPMLSLAPMVGYTGLGAYGKGRSGGLGSFESAVYAAKDAAIEYYTEKLPAQKIIDVFKSIEKSGTAKSLIEFGISEVGGEQLATLGQSMNAWAHDLDRELSDAETPGQMLAIQMERQLVTLLAATMGSGTQASIAAGAGYVARLAGRKQNEQTDSLITSLNDQAKLDSVISLSQSSSLNGRDKDRYGKLIDDLSGSENVYIDFRKLAEIRDAGEVDIPPMMMVALDNSEKTSLDIVMPMRDFASNVATDEKFTEAIRPYIRTKPLGMSQSELASPDNQPMKELLKKAMQDQQIKEESDAIWETVKDQIVATGRQSEATARYAAALIPAYVAVKAREFNQPVSQIYADMGLKVVGPDNTQHGSTLTQYTNDERSPELFSRLHQSIEEGIIEDDDVTALLQDVRLKNITIEMAGSETEKGETITADKAIQNVQGRIQMTRKLIACLSA